MNGTPVRVWEISYVDKWLLIFSGNPQHKVDIEKLPAYTNNTTKLISKLVVKNKNKNGLA